MAWAASPRSPALSVSGAGIVEVAPPYDVSGITSLAAATMALEYLCILAYQQG
jgi:arginase family enzyme